MAFGINLPDPIKAVSDTLNGVAQSGASFANTDAGKAVNNTILYPIVNAGKQFQNTGLGNAINSRMLNPAYNAGAAVGNGTVSMQIQNAITPVSNAVDSAVKGAGDTVKAITNAPAAITHDADKTAAIVKYGVLGVVVVVILYVLWRLFK